MSSAYGTNLIPKPVYQERELSAILPLRYTLKDNATKVKIQRYKEEHIPQVRDFLNFEIDAGDSYPQESRMDDDAFKNYFLSYDCFVVLLDDEDELRNELDTQDIKHSHDRSQKLQNNEGGNRSRTYSSESILTSSLGKLNFNPRIRSVSSNSGIHPGGMLNKQSSRSSMRSNDSSTSSATGRLIPSITPREVDGVEEVLGTFYIKPNFPGRCSHICNGGFITSPKYRNMGIGKVMGKAFLEIAPKLGYKSSMFNLVFTSNASSVALWRSLKFQEIGRIPKAGRLKGHEPEVDAIMFYYDFNE